MPTLQRLDVTPGATAITPIVDGIENLQFDFGVDTDAPAAAGYGAPDTFISTANAAAPTLAQWPGVMSAKVYVIARNVDRTGGYTDTKTYAIGPASSVTPGGAFKRHAYTEMVRLNNAAGRRE